MFRWLQTVVAQEGGQHKNDPLLCTGSPTCAFVQLSVSLCCGQSHLAGRAFNFQYLQISNLSVCSCSGEHLIFTWGGTFLVTARMFVHFRSSCHSSISRKFKALLFHFNPLGFRVDPCPVFLFISFLYSPSFDPFLQFLYRHVLQQPPYLLEAGFSN